MPPLPIMPHPHPRIDPPPKEPGTQMQASNEPPKSRPRNDGAKGEALPGDRRERVPGPVSLTRPQAAE